MILVAVSMRMRPRSAALPLATTIDGPAPGRAAGVVFFLHGLGGSNERAGSMVAQLRKAGLPADVAIVLVEGPYASGLGHSWGSSEAEFATSRARLRSRIQELLGPGGPDRAHVVVAGFSQGAGMAIDTAIEEPSVGAVASFSPCQSWLRGDLPKRDLRILLVHGNRDRRCPVEESRSLAKMLEAAQKPAQYIEFDGEHTVPPEGIRALAAFTTGR